MKREGCHLCTFVFTFVKLSSLIFFQATLLPFSVICYPRHLAKQWGNAEKILQQTGCAHTWRWQHPLATATTPVSLSLVFLLHQLSDCLLCRAEVNWVMQRGAELRAQSWKKIRTSIVLASKTHRCDLEGCSPGPHCTNRSSSSPFKINLLYSCYLSGAGLTCAMFESCQGISEREGIDTNQMLVKDVRNETLFVATAQSLNWFRFPHRHSLTDQGST